MAKLPQEAKRVELSEEHVRWYDEAYDRADADGHALRARMEAVLEEVGPGPGAALDAGMGPGRLVAELARRGWTVSGIDASDEMVAAARRRLPDAADRLVRAKVELLPYPDGSFDCVTATGALEYSDVPRALAEISRVLRSGGRAVVSYPNPYTHYVIWKSRVYYPLIALMKQLLRRTGRPLPRGAGTIPRHRFEQLLAAVGLEAITVRPASALVLPAPLELVFPRIAASLGRRFEDRGYFWLGTQLVFSARKAEAKFAEPTSASRTVVPSSRSPPADGHHPSGRS